jgi:hypothetical protein
MDNTLLEEFIDELARVQEYIEYSDHTEFHLETILNLGVPDFEYDLCLLAITELLNDQDFGLLNFYFHTLIQKHQPKFKYQNFRTRKRVFEYKAIIISLYGLLEKYIENWIKNYLDYLSSIIKDYNNVDKIVKDNHFNYSLNLIKNVQNDRFQHLNLDTKDLLKNLYECEASLTPYKFNSDAFITASSGNLNHYKIVDIFKALAIDLNAKLIRIDPIVNYLQTIHERINTQPPAILYEKIDDLVNRRNDISHGGEVSDILDRERLKEYAIFLKYYCEAIFEILKIDLIIKEKKHQYSQIRVAKVYPKQGILKMEAYDYVISIDDFIILEIGQEEKIIKMKVLAIKCDGVCVESIQAKVGVTVTIKVQIIDNSVKLKDNYKYYIKKSS